MPQPTITIYPNPGVCPWQAGQLAETLRSRGAKPLIVRVSSMYLQVQAPDSALGRILPILNEALGTPVLGPRYPPSPGSHVAARRVLESLILEERYWEAHEALEHLWHEGARNLRPATVLLGALALAQEGLIGPALRLARTLITGNSINVNYSLLEELLLGIVSCQPQPYKDRINYIIGKYL